MAYSPECLEEDFSEARPSKLPVRTPVSPRIWARWYPRGLGREPAGSKTTRRDVILPSSTWSQFATGTGGATVVCRSYQVKRAGPSTKTFWTAI